MRSFIDLHCHWVVDIDDGVKSLDESVRLLRALKEAGFDRVVATPHMRPGMFDNDKSMLETAFASTRAKLASTTGLPATLELASEHFVDDVVFERIVRGEALPYPGGRAVLLEFSPRAFPLMLANRFFDLMRKGLRPVIAHPERYEPVWADTAVLDPLMDAGGVLLLDVMALVGKYGKAAQRTAERLLEDGAYYAACSDSHKPSDIEAVTAGMRAVSRLAGEEELDFLFREGPTHILEGRVES
jgi:protein-tyrosine phosphatase